MIDWLETDSRVDPDGLFFTFTDEFGDRLSYTYYEIRMAAAAFVLRLRRMGLCEGDVVAIELPNGPELVIVLIACAYGGFIAVPSESSLTEAERAQRRIELERSGFPVRCVIDRRSASRMLSEVRSMPSDACGIARAMVGTSAAGRSIMGADQDLLDDVIHVAEKASLRFDSDKPAVIVFSREFERIRDSRRQDAATSVKAVPLTWRQITGAAFALGTFFDPDVSDPNQERLPFNSFSGPLSKSGQRRSAAPFWQCALPISHIAGLQVLVSSLIMRKPLLIYSEYDPEPLLHDAERRFGTHLIADHDSLLEFMTIEEWRMDSAPGRTSRLALYDSVLLLWEEELSHTFGRAVEHGMRLLLGYGMAEASGCMAISGMSGAGATGLRLLEGYDSQVLDCDEDGRGRLAISGPGVFDGYPNANTPFTVDGYFMTRDRAAIEDGEILIENITDEEFVSAGQTIFPLKVADVLRHVPGVSAAHVFGVPDSRCGMLPIAVLERDDPMLTTDDVDLCTRSSFRDYTVPISVFIFDELPRNSRGKLDRPAIEAFFAA